MDTYYINMILDILSRVSPFHQRDDLNSSHPNPLPEMVGFTPLKDHPMLLLPPGHKQMKTKPPYKISFFIMIGGLETAKPGASNSQCGTLGIHYLISVHIFSMKSVQESASQIHRLLAISDVGHRSGNNASPIRFKLHISYMYIHNYLCI